jgi:hypothetical protein
MVFPPIQLSSIDVWVCGVGFMYSTWAKADGFLNMKLRYGPYASQTPCRNRHFMVIFSFLFLSVHVDFGYEFLGCYRDMLHEHSQFFVWFFGTYKNTFFCTVSRYHLKGGSTRYVLVTDQLFLHFGLPQPSPQLPPTKWISRTVEEKRSSKQRKQTSDDKWTNLKAYRCSKEIYLLLW